MIRIKQIWLESQVEQINTLTGSPTTPWSKNAEGSLKANVGNYHLDYAYGGVRLVRHVTDGGGIRVISTDSFSTKRQLHSWMGAFITGIDN